MRLPAGKPADAAGRPDTALRLPPGAGLQRRWWRILPVIFITYSLAYLDRANYAFAAAAGLNTDLGITHNTASLLGALFFAGYFFFQIPGALCAERWSVRKLIFISLILWGALATATGLISHPGALLCIRFLLGVVEALVMPALLVYVSQWFTRGERSRANTILILGNPLTILWMSVISGYLTDGFGWRMMFIAEGFPAILWAAVWWHLSHDRPDDARWLSDSDKEMLQAVLRDEQKTLPPVSGYFRTLRSRLVITLSMLYFCWSIGVYGFVLWLPSILKNAAALGMVETGWLSAFPYLLATFAMLRTSWASDRTQTRLTYIWPALLTAVFAFIGSCVLCSHSFWLSYALLVIAGAAMYAPYGPFFALVTDILPRQVAGSAMALINGMGALGSFAGAYAVGYLNGMTHGPAASYGLMACALVIAVVLTRSLTGSLTHLSTPSLQNPAHTRDTR